MATPAQAPGRREERIAWAVVGALMVLGLGLRLPSFGDSLFGDELSAYYIVAGHSLTTMMHLLDGHSTELNPPLFFILAWAATKILGVCAPALKLVSLLTGLMSIPLLYALGRRTVGRGAGLVAAALGTLSPFLIYYSTEARPYALMLFCVLVAALAVLRALDGSPRWWALYAVAAAAAAYTHFTSVFALIALFAWTLITQPQARRALLVATAGAVVLYLPELPVLHRISQSPGTALYETLDPLTLGSARVDLGRWAIGHPYIPIDGVPGSAGALLIAGGVVLALLGLAWRARLPSGRAVTARGALIVVLALAAPVGAIAYTLLDQSVWGARNVISSWAGLGVALGAAAWLARPAALRLAATGLLVAGFALGAISMLPADHRRPDYDAAVAYLNRLAARGPIAELVAPTPGPPTETEAALDLAGTAARHPVFRIGHPSLRAVLAAAPYTHLASPRGETTARQTAAAAGDGPLFLVASISAPVNALEALRARHLHSTDGTLGYLASFLGALPARYRPVAARTFAGLLPVTVYEFSPAPA